MDWLLLTIIGAFLLTLSGIASKKALFKEHALEFTIILYFCANLMLLPNAFTLEGVSLYELLLIFLRGGLVGYGIYMLMKSYRHGDISLVSPMLNMSVVVLLILSFLLLGETLTLVEFAGVALIVIGGYVLQLQKKHSLLEPFVAMKAKTFRYLFVTMLCFSLAVIVEKFFFNTSDMAAKHFMLLSHPFSLMLLLGIYFFHGYKFRNLVVGFKKFGVLVFIAAAFDLLATYVHLLAVSIPASKVSLIIPVRRLTSLFSVVIGGKLFHEHNLLTRGIGTVVMIVGVFLIAV